MIIYILTSDLHTKTKTFSLHYSKLPKDAKTIYIARNPFDNCVANYEIVKGYCTFGAEGLNVSFILFLLFIKLQFQIKTVCMQHILFPNRYELGEVSRSISGGECIVR